MERDGICRDLAGKVLKGEVRALARTISCIENEAPEASSILADLYPSVGRACRIGITGPPGAGKSTLVNKFALALRKREKSVGILAVDPSSPFTGGALLGDRIRMNDIVQDREVYMRSMATRGSLGGLARTTSQAADVLDAAGKDYILIETVGVGQIELDVAGAVDTTIVVLVPESGGSIQAMKAGIMEIADILVINKADRPGAAELVDEILQILEMRPSQQYKTPVLLVSARQGEGIDALMQALDAHRQHLLSAGSGDEKKRLQVRDRIMAMVVERTKSYIEEKNEIRELMESLTDEVFHHRRDPFSAAHALTERLGLSSENGSGIMRKKC